jgi:hypothetical protein
MSKFSCGSTHTERDVVQLVEGAKLISNSNTTGLWVILKSVCYAEINKSFSRKKQMIISTHSDYVLNSVKPENVFRVAYNSKIGTSVLPIRKTMTSREYAALRNYLESVGNLGEYWREGGFEDS